LGVKVLLLLNGMLNFSNKTVMHIQRVFIFFLKLINQFLKNDYFVFILVNVVVFMANKLFLVDHEEVQSLRIIIVFKITLIHSWLNWILTLQIRIILFMWAICISFCWRIYSICFIFSSSLIILTNIKKNNLHFLSFIIITLQSFLWKDHFPLVWGNVKVGRIIFGSHISECPVGHLFVCSSFAIA